MLKFEEYLDNHPLKKHFDTLCDPDLKLDSHRDEVNRHVMNFVIKYAGKWFGAKVERSNIRYVRDHIANVYGESVAAVDLDFMHGTNHDTATFGEQCLLAARGSAALFKEIAFGATFAHTDSFTGLDLGSGTGILTAAMAIAARRQKIASVHCISVDTQKEAIEKSAQLLGSLGDENTHFSVTRGDITNPELYRPYSTTPPNYIVSETINWSTPPLSFDVEDNEIDPLYVPVDHIEKQIFRNIDPFPEVVQTVAKSVPHFLSLVRGKQIAIFPDFVNNRYRPDHQNGTIALRTSDTPDARPLSDVGREFLQYENFEIPGAEERWSKDDKFAKRIGDLPGHDLAQMIDETYAMMKGKVPKHLIARAIHDMYRK